jgi:hypothetical protein
MKTGSRFEERGPRKKTGERLKAQGSRSRQKAKGKRQKAKGKKLKDRDHGKSGAGGNHRSLSALLKLIKNRGEFDETIG